MSVGSAAQVRSMIKPQALAENIGELFHQWDLERQGYLEEQAELDDYIYATSTRHTTNGENKGIIQNTTTIPKITSIRETLLSNYEEALDLSNPNSFIWEGISQDEELKEKREAVKFYIMHLVKQNDFREVIKELLRSYVDRGICIAEAEYLTQEIVDDNGIQTWAFVGPTAVAHDIEDVVFNPVARKWADTPKIIRYQMTIPDLMVYAADHPELEIDQEKIKEVMDIKKGILTITSGDSRKLQRYANQGFGSWYDYLKYDMVELLQFEGNIYDQDNAELKRHRRIWVLNRTHIIMDTAIPSWLGPNNKVYAVWRERRKNLYGQGPLHQIVGLQYRCDHVENLKADALDYDIYPMLKIYGTPERFIRAPGENIYLNPEDNEDVVPLNFGAGALNSNIEIQFIHQMMEEIAGAPKQSVGFRTPGEKTAYEVSVLELGASRVFQTKIVNFEINVLEPLLNQMLALSKQNEDFATNVKIFNEQEGWETFRTITKDDIQIAGRIVPKGARHFAERAARVQSLVQGYQIAAGDPTVLAHTDSFQLAKLLFEEIPQMPKGSLVKKWIRIEQEQEAQSLQGQMQDVDNTAAEVDIQPQAGMLGG